MVCNSKVESDNAGGRQCPSFQRNQINKAGVKSSVRPGKAAMQPAIDLEELEAKLGQHENDLLEMNTNSEKLLQTWCNAGEGISDDNDASASSSQVVYLFGGGLEGRKWKAAMRLHKGADFQSWDEEEKSLRYTIALKTKELEHAENERVIFLCNPNLLVLSSYVMYGRNYQRRKKGNAVAQSTAREGRVCC
uniref:V-type proton ATPase subunit a n=1 Tax=Leersia perrieri TaxID=77586 RepID=A0A0D9WEY5_9ORYZ